MNAKPGAEPDVKPGCEQVSGYEHTHLYAHSFMGYERFLPCPLCEIDRLRKLVLELQTENRHLRAEVYE